MRDNYQTVTDRIIGMLEKGVRPWSQSWSGSAGGGRPRRVDGTPYRGANVVNLWAAAQERAFKSAYWMTFKAAQEAGASVKKGAKAELAFYVGTFTREQENASGETVEATIPFLKAYPVFNADEIEGLKEKYYTRPAVLTLSEGERASAVDTWIAGTGASVAHDGAGRAYYRPKTDSIHLPAFGAFESPAAYYETALHEIVHWSGAPARLDRTKGKMFGDPDYAFEELIAELGAAYLCADLAIESEPRENHASYVAGWLRALKSDKRAIFQAASLAERAAGYLHDLQPKAEAEAIAA